MGHWPSPFSRNESISELSFSNPSSDENQARWTIVQLSSVSVQVGDRSFASLRCSIHFSSIADNEDKLGEVLSTFGDTYRSLIATIIEKDCSLLDRRRELAKRTMNSIARSNFPRVLFRKMISDRPVFLPRSSKDTWKNNHAEMVKEQRTPILNQSNELLFPVRSILIFK